MKSKDNSEFERFKECEKQFKKSARQAKYKFEKNLSMKRTKRLLILIFGQKPNLELELVVIS